MESTLQKENELWWRKQYLEVMLSAVRSYQIYKIKKLYEYGQYFGKEAKECSDRIARLHQKTNTGKQTEIGLLPQPIKSDEVDLPW